jgi:homeobox-leucine zipper protein
MEAEGYCDTRLGLGLGGDNHEPWPQKKKEKPVVRLDLSFTLSPKNDAMDMDHHDKADGICFKSEEDEEYGIKRRDNSIDSNIDGSGRKKLRLTKEQSSLLEESFRRHTTLNPVPF